MPDNKPTQGQENMNNPIINLITRWYAEANNLGVAGHAKNSEIIKAVGGARYQCAKELEAVIAQGSGEIKDCENCDGKGWYMDGPTDAPEQVQCATCSGTGKAAVNEAQLWDTECLECGLHNKRHEEWCSVGRDWTPEILKRNGIKRTSVHSGPESDSASGKQESGTNE